MGNYMSLFSWSSDEVDVQAPVLTRAEVENDLAKKKIDCEVDEIVQEIEAECKLALSPVRQISDRTDAVLSNVTDVNLEKEVELGENLECDAVVSPDGKKNIPRKEKKWYHKFTGNVQRTEEVTVSMLSERRIQAVEKRAKEQKDELDRLLEQTKTRNRIRLLALQQKIHPEYRGKEWRFDDKENFNFAVVGCSGVGKSTFINSLLGLKPFQPGAARVSAGVEGTYVIQPYCMPGFPYIRIWDVPGGSGIDRPAETYFEDHCLDLFDAVLYLHEGRHNMLQSLILLGCKTTCTPMFIVVTKMDLLVESHLENNGLPESSKDVQEAITFIREAVTNECTSLNMRFYSEWESSRKVEIPGEYVDLHQLKKKYDSNDSHAVDCYIPFYFVSKYFSSRFGPFDAEKVVSSMKAAAALRLQSQFSSAPEKDQDSTSNTNDGSPDIVVENVDEAFSSTEGSPMPFCRSSLKLACTLNLSRDLGLADLVC